MPHMVLFSFASCIHSVTQMRQIKVWHKTHQNIGQEFLEILAALAITLTLQWARWRLKSPASGLFIQRFIQVQIKEHIKAPRHWPVCTHKRPVTRKMLCMDVIGENDRYYVVRMQEIGIKHYILSKICHQT